MPLTVRQVVEHSLYRHLRKEDAVIPFTDADKRDPMPDALKALNAALQILAATAPIFSAKRTKSVLMRAPATITASLASANQAEVTSSGLSSWMAGCRIVFDGIDEENRILSIESTTATLQNRVPSEAFTDKSATVYCDSADLPSDVITVLNPVRFVSGSVIPTAIGRDNLKHPTPTYRADDYGRRRRSVSSACNNNAYYVDSVFLEGTSRPTLRLMLRNAPSTLSNIEFEARVTLGEFTEADVFDEGSPDADPGTPIPILSNFAESIFVPIAIHQFYSTSSEFKDVDVPASVESSAKQAYALLDAMKPQGRIRPSLVPGLR